MRVTLTALAIAGGALPLAAVIWGWLPIRQDYKSLVRDLTKIDEIIQAPQGTYESPDDAMFAVREPRFNLGRMTYTYEWVQRLVLEQTVSDLRGPAWLAGVGVVLGATSSACSFWI